MTNYKAGELDPAFFFFFFFGGCRILFPCTSQEFFLDSAETIIDNKVVVFGDKVHTTAF